MELQLIPQPRQILLTGGTSLAANVTAQVEKGLQTEEYRLCTEKDGIRLLGGSARALAYARRTLEQLRNRFGAELPCAEIRDAPAFGYRAFHIDCARHLVPVAELETMIDTAAAFKFNRFHWHFSDDQGYRIESEAWPLLHRVGSVRGGDHFGRFSSDAPEGGFYTKAEVRRLVDFCTARGIEIVPEIDLPGHVTAILAAYPSLSCTGAAVAVGTKAGIYRDILCPGREETFRFVQTLLDELLTLFPGKYFHIGGDETPKERWKACPACQKRMRENGLADVRQLQGYLANRIAAYLHENGRSPIVWNEAALGGNLDLDTAVQLWNDDPEGAARRHAEKGGKLILSPMMSSYCDYPYGLISLKNMYEIDLHPAGVPQDAVLGQECLLWTEYLRTGEELEKMAWPRFAAAAEAGWCGDARPGYGDFTARLEAQQAIFSQRKVAFTGPEGWIPSPAERDKQLAAFKQNFLPQDLAEMRKAQSEV